MTSTQTGQEKLFFALVDDERKIHEVILSILEEGGLLGRSLSFYDPLSLIEYLETSEDEPDVILLDINFENSGLSGVDIIPFIRENYPFMPIILLTGMDADAMQEAQSDQSTFFIPKPVNSSQLIKMIQFYLGKSHRTREKFQALEQELQEHRDYQRLLEQELKELQDSQGQRPPERRERRDSFAKIEELISSLLQHSEIMPSFVEDLEGIFESQYGLFKKIVEILVRFDIMDVTNPGLNIHKFKGTEHVYSARLSKKVRLFFYKPPNLAKKRLLRLDAVHDTKGMDKWLKSNYSTYSA